MVVIVKEFVLVFVFGFRSGFDHDHVSRTRMASTASQAGKLSHKRLA